ncbi:MAG: hypothetical protein GXX79_02645, partial [Actinomycetales bacterium]|nr:hypothetical protein [Actinomycetales bacterium]
MSTLQGDDLTVMGWAGKRRSPPPAVTLRQRQGRWGCCDSTVLAIASLHSRTSGAGCASRPTGLRPARGNVGVPSGRRTPIVIRRPTSSPFPRGTGALTVRSRRPDGTSNHGWCAGVAHSLSAAGALRQRLISLVMSSNEEKSVMNLKKRRRIATLAISAIAVSGAAALPAMPAQAAVACNVTYSVMGQWPGGFQGGLTITNTGDAWSNWSLTFTFPSGQTITQGWVGKFSQSGSRVTVTNEAW